MARRAFFTGRLMFGMINIPIKAYPVIGNYSIVFHRLHRPCQTKIALSPYCQTCEMLVPQDEEIKGYNRGDTWILIQQADLDALIPKSKGHRPIIVQQVVNNDSIPSYIVNKSYYLIPTEKDYERPYSWAAQVLREEQAFGIVTYISHRHAHVGILIPTSPGLMLQTLHYQHQFRPLSEYGQTVPSVPLTEKEIDLGKRLVQLFRKPWDHSKYLDPIHQKMIELIEAQGRKVKPMKALPVPAPRIRNLIQQLEASLKTVRSRTSRASNV